MKLYENRFAGKVLLITGAAAGSIGGHTALRAAREGASVMCVDIKEEATHRVAAEIKEFGGQAEVLMADVSRPGQADKIVQETVDRFGRLDLALNAAGVMDGTDPTQEDDFESRRELLPANVANATDLYWERVFATNAYGVFSCLRAELRQMVAQGEGGAVVNIASIAGLTGLPGNCAYSASKHAVNGLTRSAAIDFAPHAIRVNSVNMAQTETPMVERARAFVQWARQAGGGQSMSSLKSRSLLQEGPTSAGSSPAEQAAVILFLLSDDAANVTGALWATDGGWTAY